MQLQTTNQQNENWIIIFHDGSTKKITSLQAQQIFKLSGEANQIGIKIDNGYYRFSSFSKIIPVKEYYQQYSGKQKKEYQNYTYPEGLPKDKINRILKPINNKEKRLLALTKMKQGLLNYINSKEYQVTKVSKTLLAKINNSILEAQKQ